MVQRESETEAEYDNRMDEETLPCLDVFKEHYLIHNIFKGIRAGKKSVVPKGVLQPGGELYFTTVRCMETFTVDTNRALIVSSQTIRRKSSDALAIR